MRRAARVDRVHEEIVDALRAVGCGACSLAPLGRGVPDVLCWSPYLQRLVLLELKSGRRGRLTPAQETWIHDWPGPVHVVRGTAEALAAVGVNARD